MKTKEDTAIADVYKRQVHISQVSNKFIKHPSEVVSVGDVVKVVVLEVDEKKKRISLSMKQAK